MARSSTRWLPRRAPHAAHAAVGLRKQPPQRSVVRRVVKKLRRRGAFPAARFTLPPARRSYAPTRPAARSLAADIAIAALAGIAFGTALAMATLALMGRSWVGAAAMMFVSSSALVVLVAYAHRRRNAGPTPTARSARPQEEHAIGHGAAVPQASASAFFGSGSSGSTLIRMA